MVGSIFKEEKIMINNDPLQFLLNLLGYELIEHHIYIKIPCLVLILYVEIFNVICLVEVFANGDWLMLKQYLPMIIIEQPGVVGMLIGLFSVKEFFTFRTVIFKYCWSINSAGLMIKEKIQIDCKNVKLTCFIMVFMSFLLHATFLPIVGDEEDIMYTVMFARKHFASWANLFCSLYYLCFLCSIYGLAIVMFICYYVIFHLIFQFYLLNEHLWTLSNDYNLEKDLRIDDNYQRNVYTRLILCANQHVNIKQVAKSFSYITKLPIVALTLIASPVYVAIAFFILSEVSPQSNFRMYSVLLIYSFILFTLCMYGEKLAKESNKLYDYCLSSPWTLWNELNKRALLMLMIGSSKPLKITFYNLLDINYSFIFNILKMTYKLQALLLKYK